MKIVACLLVAGFFMGLLFLLWNVEVDFFSWRFLGGVVCLAIVDLLLDLMKS